MCEGPGLRAQSASCHLGSMAGCDRGDDTVPDSGRVFRNKDGLGENMGMHMVCLSYNISSPRGVLYSAVPVDKTVLYTENMLRGEILCGMLFSPKILIKKAGGDVWR